MKESDMELKPRAMAYMVLVGTKMNQDSENSQVITDGYDGQIWALPTFPTHNLLATGGYEHAIKTTSSARDAGPTPSTCSP